MLLLLLHIIPHYIIISDIKVDHLITSYFLTLAPVNKIQVVFNILLRAIKSLLLEMK